MISKESGSNQIIDEKDKKMLLAPYSDGEDSEIEIDKPNDRDIIPSQHIFS